MDTKDDNKKRLASRIVIITSVLLCSLGSWAFTSGRDLRPAKWPEFMWTTQGIAWGAICGGVVAYFLIRTLLRRRRALYGLLYGLAAGFIIGLVNGLLTGTAPVGITAGVVLGPVPGLILALIFLKVYKPKIKEGG